MFRQGEIYEWVGSPAAPHMYIVVSKDTVHAGASTVMGVLVSSKRFDRDRGHAHRVELGPKDSVAFDRPSLAYCEQVTSVPVRAFGEHPVCLGEVVARIPEIITAIGDAMDATCWRDPDDLETGRLW